MPRDSWGAPFMAAAIAGRVPDQLFFLGLTKFLISCLRVRILRSTWPFVWWWYWVAIQIRIPRDFIICDQSLEVKRESWLRTMPRGRPWTSKIVLLSFLKIFSEVAAVTGALCRMTDPKIVTAPKTQSRSKDQNKDKDNSR